MSFSHNGSQLATLRLRVSIDFHATEEILNIKTTDFNNVGPKDFRQHIGALIGLLAYLYGLWHLSFPHMYGV